MRKARICQTCHVTLTFTAADSEENLERAREEAVAALSSTSEELHRVEVQLAAHRCASGGSSFALPLPAAPLPADRPAWRQVNVSFLLQYYKHPWTIGDIVERLWRCTHGDRRSGKSTRVTAELIVNVDSRGDAGTWEEAMANTSADGSSFLTVVLSNNLHEVHGYNRLAAMAAGRVIVLMQDDDVPPQSCGWIKYVLALFERHPRLGGVGLRGGKLWHPAAVLRDEPPFSAIEDIELRERCAGAGDLAAPLHRDPILGIPFDFVRHDPPRNATAPTRLRGAESPK